jgi:transposase
MLAELVDHVIGVDTHKLSHTLAVVNASTGAAEANETAPATGDGYDALIEFADCHTTAGSRAWVIEGTGSYGAGLTAALRAQGEWVIEMDRPSRPARRDGAKSDELDAVRAAREALARTRWAEPRSRGQREAMRLLLATREAAVRDRTRAINQLKAVVISAPEELRACLRGLVGQSLLDACTTMRDRPTQGVDHRAAVAVLRRLAARIAHLDREVGDHDRDLKALTALHCPRLLAEHGAGHVVAAQVYVSWSHPGRCRSDAAFASLAGAAPIPASSGQTVRYRLNRGGDRQLNRALHTMALTRCRSHAETQAYLARRIADGKTAREARRCLKRYLARRVYRILEAQARVGLDKT